MRTPQVMDSKLQEFLQRRAVLAERVFRKHDEIIDPAEHEQSAKHDKTVNTYSVTDLDENKALYLLLFVMMDVTILITRKKLAKPKKEYQFLATTAVIKSNK